MADSQVTWDLLARDHASATIGRVGDSVDGLTKRVTHLAGAFVGTFALQQAGTFALRMADQFEASRARLETITRNIGASFTGLSGQVSAADDRMARLGFTNAETEGSLAALETATRNPAKAFRDLALAADIARGRNISLEESTRILQRAETGHVSSLARLGIQTKDAAGHTLSLQQILVKLSETYGGNASHFADTFAGKQAALRAQLGNTASQIGVALLPSLVDLANVMQHDVLPPIEHAAEFFDRNRRVLEPLVGTVVKLGLAWKAYSVFRRLATEVSAARLVGTAATAEAAGVGALGGGWSFAHPLPVVIVGRGAGGAGTTVLSTAEKDAAVAGEMTVAQRVLSTLKGRVGTTIGLGVLSSLLSGTGHRTLGSAAQAASIGELFGGPYGAALLGGGSLVYSGISGRYNPNAPASKTANTQMFLQSNPIVFSRLRQAHPTASVEQIQSMYASGQWKDPGGVIAPSMNRAATATEHLAHAQHDLGGETQRATRSLAQQAAHLASAQSRSLALATAQDQLTTAFRNLGSTTASNKSRSLDGVSAGALANRDALRGAVQQSEAYLSLLQKQHVSQSRVATTALALAQALSKSAGALYGNRQEVAKLLGQLHFLPSQIQDALGPLIPDMFYVGTDTIKAIAAGIGAETPLVMQAAKIAGQQVAKQARLAAGLDPGPRSSFTAPPTNAAVVAPAVNLGQVLGNAVTAGYTPVVTSGLSNGTKNAVKTLQSRMRQDVAAIKSQLAQERQSLVQSVALNLNATTDSFGDQGPTRSFSSQLRANARQMEIFASLYLRLSHWASPGLLAQIEPLGPAAIPAMRQLLREGRRAIQRDNRAVARENAAAGRIAAHDTLTSDGVLIHRDLTHLPHKLAVEFAHSLSTIGINVSVDGHHHRKVRAKKK